MKYTVLSPDGIPIKMQSFNGLRAAEIALKTWCEKYQAQGYYSTFRNGYREEIPVENLHYCCKIIPTNTKN